MTKAISQATFKPSTSNIFFRVPTGYLEKHAVYLIWHRGLQYIFEVSVDCGEMAELSRYFF